MSDLISLPPPSSPYNNYTIALWCSFPHISSSPHPCSTHVQTDSVCSLLFSTHLQLILIPLSLFLLFLKVKERGGRVAGSVFCPKWWYAALNWKVLSSISNDIWSSPFLIVIYGVASIAYIIPKTVESAASVYRQAGPLILRSYHWITTRIHGQNYGAEIQEDIDTVDDYCFACRAAQAKAEGRRLVWGHVCFSALCNIWSPSVHFLSMLFLAKCYLLWCLWRVNLNRILSRSADIMKNGRSDGVNRPCAATWSGLVACLELGNKFISREHGIRKEKKSISYLEGGDCARGKNTEGVTHNCVLKTRKYMNERKCQSHGVNGSIAGLSWPPTPHANKNGARCRFDQKSKFMKKKKKNNSSRSFGGWRHLRKVSECLLKSQLLVQTKKKKSCQAKMLQCYCSQPYEAHNGMWSNVRISKSSSNRRYLKQSIPRNIQ